MSKTQPLPYRVLVVLLVSSVDTDLPGASLVQKEQKIPFAVDLHSERKTFVAVFDERYEIKSFRVS